MKTTANAGEWVELAEAARRLRTTTFGVKRLAQCGRIRTRDLAGVRARYFAEDVFRLADAQPVAVNHEDGSHPGESTT